MREVKDLPSLDWIRKLPEWCSVRYVAATDGLPAALVLHNEKHDLWVQIVPIENAPLMWSHAVNNLGSAIFEREYPDTIIPLIRREAELAQQNLPLTATLQQVKNRYKKLTNFTAAD